MNPASASNPAVTSGSAIENGPGPGDSGSGGRSTPRIWAAVAVVSAIQGLRSSCCQTDAARRPPGRTARQMLARADAGSAKNISPNRECTASNSRPPPATATRSALAASAVTPAPGRPAAESRRCAAAAICPTMSTALTQPSGATSAASATAEMPGPHPMSMIRSPGLAPRAIRAAEPCRPIAASIASACSSQTAASRPKCSAACMPAGPPGVSTRPASAAAAARTCGVTSIT